MFVGFGEDSCGLDGKLLNQDNILVSFDGFWFDLEGCLWIQIDMSGSQLSSGLFGNNQMLVVDLCIGELKCFFIGLLGCEVIGIVVMLDFCMLFINIQYLGEGLIVDNFFSIWLDGLGCWLCLVIVVIICEDG